MENAPLQSSSSTPFPDEQPPRRLRFLGLRTGMESKLLLSLMGMIALAVGMACFLTLQDYSQGIETISADHVVSLSEFLAGASRPALQQNLPDQLDLLEHALALQHDVIEVGFFDASGALISSIGTEGNARDIFNASPVAGGHGVILEPQLGDLPSVGQFISLTAPVQGRRTDDDPNGPTHVVGYAKLWVSQAAPQRELENASLKMVLVCTLVVLCCFPVAAVLTHNFFSPIRALVEATRRIIAGDLDAQVEVDRQDVIGRLARSFNQMVQRVRRQQEDLAAANRELETNIQQRTAQLQTANQRLSREIAEKEDFLRAVSHDLNAPLRNISGMAAMVLRNHQDLDADVVHRLERIQKNVEAETGLITELLELSRIKTQRQPMEVVDTRALVGEVAGLFEADLRSREISFCIDTELPTLKCEPSRLRQVFQNLIDNAIKYMGDRPEQAREIHIGCAVRGEEAEFYVGDTGIGIPAADVETLFNVFRRGSNAKAAGVAGKGIGLASAKSIVETYSGTIWAESLMGRGATFRFTINGQYLVNPAASSAA